MLALANQPTPNRMSSREVAELTGKRHDNVLRDIREMCATLHSSNLSFVCEPATYTAGNGQQYEMLLMDKDTTVCLLTGYDVVARMKVIKRWQELESGLALPRTLPEALRALANTVEEKEALQLQLDEARPAVETMQALTESGEGLSMAEVTKTLAIPGLGQNNLFDLLREEHVIQPKPSTEPYQRHVDSGHFKRIQQPYQHGDKGTRLGGKTLVTPSGVLFIKGLIDRRNSRAA